MGELENESVSAGVAGFVVLFFLAVACWLLFRSMNNHLRRIRWRYEREERLAQQARDAQEGHAAGQVASPAEDSQAADTPGGAEDQETGHPSGTGERPGR